MGFVCLDDKLVDRCDYRSRACAQETAPRARRRVGLRDRVRCRTVASSANMRPSEADEQRWSICGPRRPLAGSGRLITPSLAAAPLAAAWSRQSVSSSTDTSSAYASFELASPRPEPLPESAGVVASGQLEAAGRELGAEGRDVPRCLGPLRKP